ncbi:MAG: PTS sugar transporter subunit IIA [Lacrimispora sp.]
MPHAYEGHVKKQGIGLMTLKHPVIWDNEEKVQIILMLSIDVKLKESFKVIFNELANITKDMMAVDQILNADKFSDISKIFK